MGYLGTCSNIFQNIARVIFIYFEGFVFKVAGFQLEKIVISNDCLSKSCAAEAEANLLSSHVFTPFGCRFHFRFSPQCGFHRCCSHHTQVGGSK